MPLKKSQAELRWVLSLAIYDNGSAAAIVGSDPVVQANTFFIAPLICL
jgi:hypothetical protein